MKKFFSTIFLLMIIIVSSSFCILYVSFNLMDPSNSINTSFRKRVLIYPTLRKIMKLHQVGDARYEYTYKKLLPLVVHVYAKEGESLNPKTIDAIKTKLQGATIKYYPVQVVEHTLPSSTPESVTDTELNTLLQTYTYRDLFAKNVPLNIFVLRYYTPHNSYAGLVLDDYSLFLFKDSIRNVADKDELISPIETSTILHEFAHLQGADHIPNQNCILADTVENLNFYNKIEDIQDEYCPEDMLEIQKALQF